MKATNVTRGAVLHENVRVAKTFSEKTEGLTTGGARDALFFRTRFGIHTFGMKFPIDCAVTDDGGRVVALRENIVPGHFFFWNPRYKNVLELPAGTISRTSTRMGDAIELL